MKLFKRIEYSGKTIPLSIGTVKVKVLRNGIVNKILSKSCIAENILNKYLLLQLFEYALVDLKRKQIDKLSVSDGDKIRAMIKSVLLEHGILSIQKEEPVNDDVDLFKQEDVEWFNKEKHKQLSKIGVTNG